MSINVLFSAMPVYMVVATNKPPNIDFIASLYRYMNILIWELPAIRIIAFAANMAFITVKQIDYPLFRKAL
jgi:hypothetical protein